MTGLLLYIVCGWRGDMLQSRILTKSVHLLPVQNPFYAQIFNGFIQMECLQNFKPGHNFK